MKKIAIHQPNFCPWFPFFYKMAMVDVFVLLNQVQFEKNGFQNRFFFNGRWITKPVHKRTEMIFTKNYIELSNKDMNIPELGIGSIDGGSLHNLNKMWIKTIKHTLNITTQLTSDSLTTIYPYDPTERIIKIVKDFEGDVYVTNPDAKDKYLNENKVRDAGLEIEYFKVPRNLKKGIFDMLGEYGVEGTIKQLPKKEVLCEV